MTTTEARKSLPQLARDAARRAKAGKGLLDNAVEIQPRGERRSAYLVPEVDLEAAQRRIAELEEELEDVALVRMLEERLQRDTGNLTPVDDIIGAFGFDELRSDSPAAER
jgi:hypothetical protein